MTHAPHLGEHSAEILAEWGYSDDAIADLIAKKAVALPEKKPPQQSKSRSVQNSGFVLGTPRNDVLLWSFRRRNALSGIRG